MDIVAKLTKDAHDRRRDIIDMIFRAGSGHSGGSLSSAEILTCLYGAVMKHNPKKPFDDDRDRFILSKGHAAPLLYSILAYHEYFPKEELSTLRQMGSALQGHPCRNRIPGIELSTGSLGLGISAGLGMALTGKLQNKAHRVYVLCGDGEMNEGQNWEAFMSIRKWNPPNLTVIIDYNQVQLDGNTRDIMPTGDLKAKIQSFGIRVISCDGHDINQLLKAFHDAKSAGETVVILAKTTKGKGISFMEDNHTWHGKKIEEAEYHLAIAELERKGMMLAWNENQ